MGDRADETNFSNIKYTLYEKFVRWLKYLIDCRNAKQSCLDLIKRTNLPNTSLPCRIKCQ